MGWFLVFNLEPAFFCPHETPGALRVNRDVTRMRCYWPNRLPILIARLAMNMFSKFGVCLICMLALVLLAVTPNTATSDVSVDSSIKQASQPPSTS